LLKNFDTSEINSGSARLNKLLQEAVADFNVLLSDQQSKNFLLYYEELKFWNSRVNLISSSESAADIFIKHFLDSLTLIPFIPLPDSSLLDIGTGGGFPGIPLKIALNSLNVTLLEASRKKVSFLKSLNRLLNLNKIQVLQERVECLLQKEQYRNRFDIVVSRAALKLPEYLRFGKELVTPDGLIIAMKGVNYQLELDEIQENIEDWGLFLAEVHSLTLPLTGDFRVIMIFKRSRNDS